MRIRRSVSRARSTAQPSRSPRDVRETKRVPAARKRGCSASTPKERRANDRAAGSMKLLPGIGIVAPSGYVTDPAALERAAGWLSANGFRVIVDEAVRARDM